MLAMRASVALTILGVAAAGTDDVLIRCGQTGADNDVDDTHIIATLINN